MGARINAAGIERDREPAERLLKRNEIERKNPGVHLVILYVMA